MILTTPGKQERQTVAAETNFSEKIPYAHLLDDETVETKSGHLMQTIKLDGLFFETLDGEWTDQEKRTRNTLLISLADSTTSLYFHPVRKREARLLGGTYEHYFAKQLHQKWQAQLSQRAFFINEHYLTVVKKPPVGKIRRASDIVPSLFNKIDKQARDAYRQKQLADLNKITKRVLAAFSHYGARKLSVVHCEQMGRTISEVLSFLSRLINLADRDIVPPKAGLSHYLPYKRAFFDKHTGTFALRDVCNQSVYAALLSIKNYAGTTNAGCLDALLSVPAEMVITQSFSFLDKNDARGKAQEQARNQLQSDDGETTENFKIGHALDELGSGTAVVGTHHISVLCQADSLLALDAAVSAADAALNQLGMVAVREDRGLKAAFFAMLPANHAYITRPAVITSRNLAGLASLHNYSTGKFQGNHWGEAITVLETRSGTPFYFNFHVQDVANTVLIGPQGSGKTLLETFLLALSMKYGGRLVFFDIDETLKAFVLAMEGKYETVSAGTPTGFAPFQMDDTPSNRHFLIELLGKIAGLNGAPPTDEDNLRLKAAVDGAYALPKEKRILRNVVPFLGMNKAGSLRMRFENWVNGGAYAWAFDNDIDTLSLNASVMGFDMGSILKDSNARAPIYYYLFHRLDQMLDGTRTRIVVAEAWRALQDEFFLNKIREWESTPRKKEAFLILDTQSPEDIARSYIGHKIIQESTTQIYFANPKANYDDYVLHFGLTEKELDTIQNLDKTSYFFLLKQGKTSTVARLYLEGFDDEMNVLSWRVKNKKTLDLDAIIKAAGAVPQQWLPALYQKIKSLKAEQK